MSGKNQKETMCLTSCLAGAEVWARFINEGKPVQGSPELFEFGGMRCNQPFYDENKVNGREVMSEGW